MSGYVLIDPPVTPYSTVLQIKAWIRTLERMEDSGERNAALQDARKLLTDREKRKFPSD